MKSAGRRNGQRKSSCSTVERRRFIRVVEGCHMNFVSSKGDKGEGEVLDLSLRGVRFLSVSVLRTGDKIRTAFQPGNEITLDLAGIIRHTHRKSAKRWIYGVEFFIQDYRDLKEHLKLNSYIIHARAEQDHLLQKKLLKKRGI